MPASHPTLSAAGEDGRVRGSQCFAGGPRRMQPFSLTESKRIDEARRAQPLRSARLCRPLCRLCLLLILFSPASLRAEDIVLGMSAAFRGPSRGLGIELYRGSMAYLEHVNRTGGVQGRKIVIKAYDDGYSPIPAIENTVRLIEQDNPLLLYGYVGTPTVTRVLPLLKIYSDRSMYLFFPFTGAQPQRQPPYD